MWHILQKCCITLGSILLGANDRSILLTLTICVVSESESLVLLKRAGLTACQIIFSLC